MIGKKPSLTNIKPNLDSKPIPGTPYSLPPSSSALRQSPGHLSPGQPSPGTPSSGFSSGSGFSVPSMGSSEFNSEFPKLEELSLKPDTIASKTSRVTFTINSDSESSAKSNESGFSEQNPQVGSCDDEIGSYYSLDNKPKKEPRHRNLSDQSGQSSEKKKSHNEAQDTRHFKDNKPRSFYSREKSNNADRQNLGKDGENQDKWQGAHDRGKGRGRGRGFQDRGRVRYQHHTVGQTTDSYADRRGNRRQTRSGGRWESSRGYRPRRNSDEFRKSASEPKTESETSKQLPFQRAFSDREQASVSDGQIQQESDVKGSNGQDIKPTVPLKSPVVGLERRAQTTTYRGSYRGQEKNQQWQHRRPHSGYGSAQDWERDGQQWVSYNDQHRRSDWHHSRQGWQMYQDDTPYRSSSGSRGRVHSLSMDRGGYPYRWAGSERGRGKRGRGNSPKHYDNRTSEERDS